MSEKEILFIILNQFKSNTLIRLLFSIFVVKLQDISFLDFLNLQLEKHPLSFTDYEYEIKQAFKLEELPKEHIESSYKNYLESYLRLKDLKIINPNILNNWNYVLNLYSALSKHNATFNDQENIVNNIYKTYKYILN